MLAQAGPLTATLVPDAFDGQNAYATMQSLATAYPNRPPGSYGDNQMAGYVAGALKGDGFLVNRTRFTAQTVNGPRTIQTRPAQRSLSLLAVLGHGLLAVGTVLLVLLAALGASGN